jgi:hypothetical protein
VLQLKSRDSEGVPVMGFLDEKRNQIASRLKELEPLVDEDHRLDAAASELAGTDVPAPIATASATTAGAAATTSA